ncbi:uncharacterized protein TNCV_4429831 [Trichonephila clavipes]|nr:uncharacterized protein TNCV_4429831 [Trichonephila clavipes]
MTEAHQPPLHGGALVAPCLETMTRRSRARHRKTKGEGECRSPFSAGVFRPHHEYFAFQTPRAAVAEWYRYRTVACLVTSSSPVPLKTRRVGQRCTLNLSRAETSSSWCGVGVRRGSASSGVVHVT